MFLLVALWTMKVMEIIPEKHLLFFFCIDYTIWPGKNSRNMTLIWYEHSLTNGLLKFLIFISRLEP